MDYEKKLALAKEALDSGSYDKETIEYIFPELKESDDEQHRKWILEYLYDGLRKSDEQFKDHFKCAIAWLEKQSKQKPDTDFSNIRIWKYIVDEVLTEKEGIGQYLDSSFTEEVAKKLQKRFGNIEQKPAFEMKTPEESLGIDSDTYNKIVDECVYGEQKPAWSEEDEKLVKNLISTLSNLYARNLIEKETKEKYTNLLKSLKDRVQPQPKQEWSEEDKGNLLDVKCIIDEVWHNQYVREKIEYSGEELESLWHWLDNIWQRVEYPQNTWKPSDEQMKALEHFVRSIGESGYASPYDNNTKLVYSLLSDLKKLMEK